MSSNTSLLGATTDVEEIPPPCNPPPLDLLGLYPLLTSYETCMMQTVGLSLIHQTAHRRSCNISIHCCNIYTQLPYMVLKVISSTLNWAQKQEGSQHRCTKITVIRSAQPSSQHTDCSILHQLKFPNTFQPHIKCIALIESKCN